MQHGNGGVVARRGRVAVIDVSTSLGVRSGIGIRSSIGFLELTEGDGVLEALARGGCFGSSRGLGLGGGRGVGITIDGIDRSGGGHGDQRAEAREG